MFSKGKQQIELKCRHYLGRIVYKMRGQNVFYLNQIDDWDCPTEEYQQYDEAWIHGPKMGEYIFTWYGISLKQYLNLVITGDIENSNYELPGDKYIDRLCNEDYVHLQSKKTQLINQWSQTSIEIIHKDDQRYFQDLISPEYKLIECSQFTKYLRRTYGITTKNYFDLIYHNNINHFEKCPYCDQEKSFYSLINGYAETCTNPDCQRLGYSSRSHIMWTNRSDEDRKYILDRLHKSASEVTTQATASWSKFLRSGELTDICEFYIATTKDNKFKFGVSSNADARAARMKYNNIRVILVESREVVADIEYMIKVDLNLTNEYLEFSPHNIIRFVRSFLTNKNIRLDSDQVE